tara:strand:- start:53 stop:568 length:516 start_codon:yes stop_codon:yes gene_type:complete
MRLLFLFIIFFTSSNLFGKEIPEKIGIEIKKNWSEQKITFEKNISKIIFIHKNINNLDRFSIFLKIYPFEQIEVSVFKDKIYRIIIENILDDYNLENVFDPLFKRYDFVNSYGIKIKNIEIIKEIIEEILENQIIENFDMWYKNNEENVVVELQFNSEKYILTYVYYDNHP